LRSHWVSAIAPAIDVLTITAESASMQKRVDRLMNIPFLLG
jgi:hypothetical protein